MATCPAVRPDLQRRAARRAFHNHCWGGAHTGAQSLARTRQAWRTRRETGRGKHRTPAQRHGCTAGTGKGSAYTQKTIELTASSAERGLETGADGLTEIHSTVASAYLEPSC